MCVCVYMLVCALPAPSQRPPPDNVQQVLTDSLSRADCVHVRMLVAALPMPGQHPKLFWHAAMTM